MPNTIASANPAMVVHSVTNEWRSNGRQYCAIAANAADGAGRMNGSMEKMRQAASQIANNAIVNSQGDSFSSVLVMRSGPRRPASCGAPLVGPVPCVAGLGRSPSCVAPLGRPTSCLADLGNFRAQLVHDIGELRLVTDVEVARPRQVDMLGQDDAPGTAAHHV